MPTLQANTEYKKDGAPFLNLPHTLDFGRFRSFFFTVTGWRGESGREEICDQVIRIGIYQDDSLAMA